MTDPGTPREHTADGAALVGLLRQRLQVAYDALGGGEPDANVVELDAALEHLDAALLDENGETLVNAATQAVAWALLDLPEHPRVFRHGDPEPGTEVLAVLDSEAALAADEAGRGLTGGGS